MRAVSGIIVSPLLASAGLLWLVSACADIQPPNEESNAENGLFIDTVSPSSGPLPGQTIVTVVGGDFVPGETRVLLGGIPSIDVEVIDRNTLVFRAPPATSAGPVDISVFNANGFGIGSDAYTYQPAIELASISPSFSNASGGGTATLSGAGFQDTAPGPISVKFGGLAIEAVVVNDSTITFKIPAGEPWTDADISVSSRNGRATLSGGFAYMLPGLLAVDQPNGNLLHIDPITGSTTQIRNGNTPSTALAMSKNGKLYAAHNPHGAVQLPHISRIFVGGKTPEVVVAMTEDNAGGLEVVDGQHLVTAIRYFTSGIISFDIETGRVSEQFAYPLATAGDCRGCAMAQSPDGQLFAAFEGTSGSLFQLSGGVFEVATTLQGIDDDNIRAMTFSGPDLFALRRGSGDLPSPGGSSNNLSTLTRIDLATGVLTDIVTLPGRLDGLTTVPPAPAN